MQEIEEKLIIRDDCPELSLVGLGGVGKTQVALQLVYTVKERWPEYSIFWVPAASAESFEQAYRAIATECSVALNPTVEDLKDSVKRYLNGNSAGEWLLIVDNADDEEILFGRLGGSTGISDFLPESERGRTLFTTRHREIAVSLASSAVVDIQARLLNRALGFVMKMLWTGLNRLKVQVTIEVLATP